MEDKNELSIEPKYSSDRVFIIDNNDYINEKSISVFKEMPFKNGLHKVQLVHGVQINNVMNGRVIYSLVDIPNNCYNNEIQSSFPIEGIRMKITNRSGGILRDEILMRGDAVTRQTTVNKIIGSFDYSYPVNVEVYAYLNSGYVRALLESFLRDRNEHPRLDMSYLRCYVGHCGGGGGSSPPPATSYSSLFEHMKVMVNYNLTAGNQKDFFRFRAKFNEFKEGGNVYSFKETFEIDNSKGYTRVAVGINENMAADISHYNYAWKNPEEKPEVEGPVSFINTDATVEKAPCNRTHIIGDLLKEKITEDIEDFTTGELLEEPYHSEDVTESDIMSAQDYFEMSIGKLINGTVTIYSHGVFSFEDEESVDFINFNVLLRKDEKKLYLTVEFACRVHPIYGFEHDRLRFKSDLCIGALFMV